MKGIGQMRHTIQLIQVESLQDSSGRWVQQADNVLATVHAKVNQLSGNDLAEYEGQLGLNNQLDFDIRYPVNFPINTNIFILYNNRTYRIEGVKLIDEKLFKYRLRGVSRDPATIEI